MEPPSKDVKHTKIGVWDLYEDTQVPVSARFRSLSWPGFKSYAILAQTLPYVWRMIKDIASTPDCSILLLAYLLVELAVSLVPAVSLYYSGKLLTIVSPYDPTRPFAMLSLFLGTNGGRPPYRRQALAVPRRGRKFYMFHCRSHITLCQATHSVPTSP